MGYESLIVETRGAVGLITLDRPEAMNALNGGLMDELTRAIGEFEADEAIGCMVLTGNDKAFAAGADIKEMQATTHMEAYVGDLITANWEAASRCRKPIIAAVAGYALGGGCELAMMCDFILAADSARFGQPEIKIGIIPGAGGTQRLPRIVGFQKAKDIVYSGRFVSASEATEIGLADRVIPKETLLDEALADARKWDEGPTVALGAAKAAINGGWGEPMRREIEIEAEAFQKYFWTDDAKEGVAAFIEKREPTFRGR